MDIPRPVLPKSENEKFLIVIPNLEINKTKGEKKRSVKFAKAL